MDQFHSFITAVAKQIVNPIIILLAIGAVIIFLWGVAQFVMNAGDSAGREEGRRHILWGLIGLVIIFGAVGLLNIALSTFGIDPILLPGGSSSRIPAI